MDKERISDNSTEKFKSLSHALKVLDDAAAGSAHEIRKMVNTDYSSLKRVLSEIKPNLKEAVGDIKDVALDSMTDAKEKMVSSTKETAKKVDESVRQYPWIYLGGVAVTSILVGFFLGRSSQK